MRQIGTIPDGDQAEQFADFLRAEGMACNLDRAENGWAVWIQNEDHMPSAKEELQAFLADPAHEKYRDARRKADAKLRDDFAKRKAVRKRTVSLRDRWDRPLGERCPLTMGLLITCAVVAFFTRLGGMFLMPGEERADFEPLIQQLQISPDNARQARMEVDRAGNARLTSTPTRSWRAIRSGEVWRIWTPMFLHFGWLHLLFNSFWLRDFGMLLEDRVGSLRFLLLVLVIGAVSNILQFQIVGPNFGGMSGVNYGLFGYLWVRGKLDPNSGLGVSEQTVLWMGVWYIVCWLPGLSGDIANWAHAGGLAAGVTLGALAAIRRR